MNQNAYNIYHMLGSKIANMLSDRYHLSCGVLNWNENTIIINNDNLPCIYIIMDEARLEICGDASWDNNTIRVSLANPRLLELICEHTDFYLKNKMCITHAPDAASIPSSSLRGDN